MPNLIVRYQKRALIIRYRASLESKVNALHALPSLFFVYVPPCVGHACTGVKAQNYLSSIVRVALLKEAIRPMIRW